MTVPPYGTSIEPHYASFWSEPLHRATWARGPIGELPRDFGVLTYGRSAEINAYATRCMAQAADDARLELHLLVPEEFHTYQPARGGADRAGLARTDHRGGSALRTREGGDAFEDLLVEVDPDLRDLGRASIV